MTYNMADTTVGIDTERINYVTVTLCVNDCVSAVNASWLDAVSPAAGVLRAQRIQVMRFNNFI